MKELAHKKLHLTLGILVSISLLILVFVGGLYVAERYFGEDGEVVVDDAGREEEGMIDDLSDEGPVDEEVDEEYEVTDFITVDWYDEVLELDEAAPAFSAIATDSNPYAIDVDSAVVYELGIVVGGEYDGYMLRQEFVGVDGLGRPYAGISYLVPNSVVLPIVYLVQEESYYSQMFSNGGSAYVTDFYADVLEDRLNWRIDFTTGVQDVGRVDQRLANGVEIEYYMFSQPPYAFFYDDEAYPVVGDPSYPLVGGGVAYLSLNNTDLRKRNLLYIIGDGGIVYWYAVKTPFDSEYLSEPFIPFLDSALELGAYTTGTPGGCGFSTLYSVATDDREISSLRPFAVTKEGVQLYKPESYDQFVYRSAYDLWGLYHEDSAFADFEATYPFLYYKDGLNRWVKLMSTEVIAGAECGKPVIYLYPEETTDMTVWVDPVGGFTKVVPDYNDGWRVTASPDGQLVNRDDGKAYPYLFWEGRGGAYSSPNKYWVVAQEELDEFLPTTLLKLGLNKAEMGDFLEFWRPRMMDAPYYKIGFWGTDMMDRLAPLKISEQPDMVLRILMDYEELQQPEQSNPPMLPKTPERKGFTVIEWGGVIR